MQVRFKVWYNLELFWLDLELVLVRNGQFRGYLEQKLVSNLVQRLVGFYLLYLKQLYFPVKLIFRRDLSYSGDPIYSGDSRLIGLFAEVRCVLFYSVSSFDALLLISFPSFFFFLFCFMLNVPHHLFVFLFVFAGISISFIICLVNSPQFMHQQFIQFFLFKLVLIKN